MAEPLTVVIEQDDDSAQIDPATGDINVPQADGGVVVHLNAAKPAKDEDDEGFYENLVEKIGAGNRAALGILANDLYEQIDADDQSRKESLEIDNRGFDLLGLKLEEPKASVGDASSTSDGMATVTNPLMLDAILTGWANASAELLPASGPVKIKDDGDTNAARDGLAEAYERDWNHWFTVTATEYYPDTSHMLLWGTHFRGSGFKKIYRCPLRRRPVSESVEKKDLIVSNTMKDLRSCGRITHQISMRPSTMRRMQIAGAYRNVALGQPSPTPSSSDQKTAETQGTQALPRRPEDQPYTVWETQCELDLPQFAPGIFKDEGIPLPYLVTMDKDSKEILAIRRDWDENDDQCQRKRMYVRYPYVPGPGFYGTGLLNILGNSSAATTGIWRMALDAGMFASFPGGLIAKDATRQNSSQFRVAPGEFAPVDAGGKDIRQSVMPMPYKDVTPGLLALLDKIVAQAQKVGAAAEVPAGEGLANVPVGTMLAQIEQATKVMAAAFKGMHTAQSEEIELLVDLMREHPEDFWRTNSVCPQDYWDEQKFLTALDDCKLVPVSDPNVPSQLHRVAKAVALVQLTMNPALVPRLNVEEVLRRALNAMREDPIGLILPPAAPAAGPDPQAQTAAAKLETAQAQSTKAQADAGVAQAKAAQAPQDTQIEAAKLQNERDIAAADIQKEQIIHGADVVKATHDAAIDRGDQALKAVKTAHDIGQDQHQRGMDVAQHGLAVGQAQHDASLGVAQHALDVHQALNPPQPAAPAKG